MHTWVHMCVCMCIYTFYFLPRHWVFIIGKKLCLQCIRFLVEFYFSFGSSIWTSGSTVSRRRCLTYYSWTPLLFSFFLTERQYPLFSYFTPKKEWHQHGKKYRAEEGNVNIGWRKHPFIRKLKMEALVLLFVGSGQSSAHLRSTININSMRRKLT